LRPLTTLTMRFLRLMDNLPSTAAEDSTSAGQSSSTKERKLMLAG
jgi:hypothetical protein